MKSIYNIIFIVIVTLYCSHGHAQVNIPAHGDQLKQDSVQLELINQQKAIAERFSNIQVFSMVCKTKNGMYGYYIFADGQMLIEQNTVPGLQGNQGFISIAEAERTAVFAIGKLKAGVMPPTITVEELKQLKITTEYPKLTNNSKHK
jgi:hypothetical protein